MNKYYNKKVVYEGIKFDSIKEKNRYVELKLLERAGAIKELSLQPKFILQEGFEYCGKRIQAINYIADFKYFDNEKKRWVVEDVKGFKENRAYIMKKKMFIKLYRHECVFIET